jgi:SPP1 gp7 family putative phage head morphogenesis protein
MPDLPSRDDWERKLARLLGRFFGQRLNDLIEQLGDPPNLNNVSQAWYDSLDEVEVPLVDVLEAIYLDSAKMLLDTQRIGTDWGLVNARAVEWARQYGFGLVKDINTTTRRDLQSIIPGFFEESGRTIGDLKAALSGTFGPVRAEMIAITETTRAASEGQVWLEDELRKDGIATYRVWQTNKDEQVCPICSPRDGKRITDGNLPPAHPRCRCWWNLEVEK